MGELILCKEHTAASPFFVEDMAINLYSMEELCYYIENNALFLSDSIMSVDLIHWIDHQLRLPALALKLQEAVSSGASLEHFLTIILRASDYCTPAEQKAVASAVHTMENKSPEETLKLRADRLMSKSKFLDALYLYRRILSEGNIKVFSPAELAAVWHNQGCAYANLFQFEQAARSYEKAFDIGRNNLSLRQLLFCALCSGDDMLFSACEAKYALSPDVRTNLTWELKKARESKNKEALIKAMQLLDYPEGKQELDSVLSEWKQEYRRICSI